MIKQFYQHLGMKFVRQENGKNGPELIFECPWCNAKTLSVNSETGAYQCFKGCGKGFPYQIARDIGNLEPKPIFELLEQFGLGKDSDTAARTRARRSTPTVPSLKRENVMQLPLLDQLVFCAAKGVDRESLLKLKPLKHRTKPWVLLPAFDPKDMGKACGWIRVGVDGSLIPIKYQDGEGVWQTKLEKYPVIAGSNVGLLGLHTVDPMNDTVIFAEGWKDMLAAIHYGFDAVCCNMGAGKWRESWLRVFDNKHVLICFDADAAGVKGAEKVAAEIDGVAKSVKVVVLPFEYRETNGLDLFDYLKGVRE